MKRRAFFQTLAALFAAPKVIEQLPKRALHYPTNIRIIDITTHDDLRRRPEWRKKMAVLIEPGVTSYDLG
jgi:hypothetical protein